MKKIQFGFIAIPFILAVMVMLGGGYYFIDHYSKPESNKETEEIVIEKDSNPIEIQDKVKNKVEENIDVVLSTSTPTSTSTLAPTTIVKKEDKKIEVKVEAVPVVIKKPFITISKKDLFERNIAKFTHLDWTYDFTDKLAFMGKSGFNYVNGPSHSVGYTLTGDDIVNYYTRLIQLDSYEDAKALLNEVKNDNDTYIFNKSFPLVYGLQDPNSRSVMWVHNNILIMIHANAGPGEDLYLKTAFNVYIDIYPAN